ncbi:helix-turn-helix transcriptional regulator [Mycolicibacterium sphagni]|nr:helix-turn-helix transcriptional regulator [Mycolicibacterium sphagni]
MLLDSIEKLLQSTSIADLSMEAIASAGSLSRTSVYFYFGNKSDAVDALIARATVRQQERRRGRSYRPCNRTDAGADVPPRT